MNCDDYFDKKFLDKFNNLSVLNKPSVQEEYAKLPKLDVCPRKDPGIRGRNIELLVNWFRITLSQKIFIRVYDVTIEEVPKYSRRGRSATSNDTKIINKELEKEVFWRAVSDFKSREHSRIQTSDDVVFDSPLAFLPDFTIREELMRRDLSDDHMSARVQYPSANREKTYSVILRFVGRFPLNPSSENQTLVDFSQKFMKALVTQRVRYATTALSDREFREKWYFSSGTIYRIPKYVTHGSREDDQMTVLPGIRAWIGLYASLKSGEYKDIFMNFGLVNSLFYRMDLDLISFYIEVCKDLGDQIPDDFSVRLETMGMGVRQRQRMSKLVRDLRVKSTAALCYEEESKPKRAPRTSVPRLGNAFLAERHFRIIEIGSEGPRTFITEKGCTMEEQYYRLGYTLRWPFLPVVHLRQARKVCVLPMEVLVIHDSPQKYSRTLDFYDSRKFIKRVCRTPDQYKSETDKMLKELCLGETNTPFLSRYKAKLDLEFTKCPARVLEPPVIRDHEGKSHALQEDRSYRIKEVSESTGPIVMDVVIPLEPKTLQPILIQEHAGFFYDNLKAKMIERGLEVDSRQPQVYEAQYLPDRSNESLYDNDIDTDNFFDPEYKYKPGTPTISTVIKDAQRLFKETPDYKSKRHIILIFGIRGLDLYGRIKRICDRLVGMVTQNVNRDTVNKALIEATQNKHTIFFNLALKINVKLGGINTRADVPLELHDSEDPKVPSVMYVGIDVTHPGVMPGRSPWEDNLNASVAAMVGSYDVGGTKYKTYYMAQLEVKETVERFDSQFHNLMMDFFEENNAFPLHVVIYRDGVSDSEIIRTCCIELNWIKASWEKIIKTNEHREVKIPTFTYIVVQKRHTTRFIYPNKQNGNVVFENPPSGTLVDKLVVSHKMFDFWLTAQHGALGTSRPIHYTVVYDEWNLSQDKLGTMTYRLCFLNARCRKPCALPAPVYYAHLACSQGKEVYRDFVRHSPSDERTATRQAEVEAALNVNKDYPGMPFT